MARIIFHIDVNSAFLSWTAVEQLKNGSKVDLREIPAIIGGDQSSRHGIVLAKSSLAKSYGIQTGEPVVNAFRKCPNLVTAPPNHKMYREKSRMLMDFLRTYTKKIEQVGVKTTIITDEYAGQDGKSQSLADADPLADAVVTGGNANEVIILPAMDKVIGTLDYVDKIAGGHAGSLREDGSIEAELQVITGATNEMGFNCLSAR